VNAFYAPECKRDSPQGHNIPIMIHFLIIHRTDRVVDQETDEFFLIGKFTLDVLLEAFQVYFIE
jgi:hypothetical protein